MLLTKICNRGEEQSATEEKKMASLLEGMVNLKYLQDIQVEVLVSTESVTTKPEN